MIIWERAARRSRVALGLAASLLLAVPVAAGAASISIMLPADVVAQTSRSFTVDGDATGTSAPRVRLYAVPAGAGEPCPPPSTYRGNELPGSGSSPNRGPFSVASQIHNFEAGTYRVCAYLFDTPDDINGPIAATDDKLLTVRPPQLGLTIEAPGDLVSDRAFSLTATVMAETPHDLFFGVIADTGSGCPADGAGVSFPPGLAQFFQGGPTRLTSEPGRRSAGQYLACGYLSSRGTTRFRATPVPFTIEPPPAKLRLAARLAELPATVGRPLKQRARVVVDDGPAAEDVRVTFTLPPGTIPGRARIFRADGSSTPLACTPVDQRVTCALGSLPLGAVRTVELDATPRRAGAYKVTVSATHRGPAGGVLTTTVASPATSALPAPRAGRTANVARVSGHVFVRVPGARGFVPLENARSVPVGTTIDTRTGRIGLVSAAPRGRTRRAEFYDGQFLLRQKADAALTDVKLTGPLARCSRFGTAGAAASARKRRSRRVWGDGGGGHRTSGQRAAATVRGTRWLVEDRCDGTTRVQVANGVVSVKVVGRRRPVIVRAPRSYVTLRGR